MSPPYRILSFEQMVLEADPAYQLDSIQPVIYEMSNGREFYRQIPVYPPECPTPTPTPTPTGSYPPPTPTPTPTPPGYIHNDIILEGGAGKIIMEDVVDDLGLET